MDSESREPRAWIVALHSQVEGQVVFGDTKAGQLLAADSILLAALVLLANEFRNDVSTATLVLVASTAMLLGLSILIVLVAIAPAQRLLGTRSIFRNRLWTTALGQEEVEQRRAAWFASTESLMTRTTSSTG